MNCKKCNAFIPEGGVFCPACGQKVEQAPETGGFSSPFRVAGGLGGDDFGLGTPVAETPRATAPVAEKPAPLDDGGVRFSSNFRRENTTPVTPTPGRIPAPEAPAPKPAAKSAPVFTPVAPKKRIKKGGVIALCVVAALLVVVAVGMLTDWFGFYGPAAKILAAAEKTLTAKSFTVEIISDIDGIQSRATLDVAINPKKREFTMYGTNDSGVVMAIYDGYIIEKSKYGIWCQDISDNLDRMFDMYEEFGDKDFDLAEFIEEFYDKNSGGGGRRTVDFDELDRCISAYTKKLNSTSWLKKNAGYSVKLGTETVYTFKPDLYKFAKASLPFFKKAVIDSDDYDEMLDGLEEAKNDLKDVDFKLAFHVKGGKLVQLTVTDDKDDQIKVKFKNIGNAKIDTDELEDLLSEAKNNSFRYSYY